MVREVEEEDLGEVGQLQTEQKVARARIGKHIKVINVFATRHLSTVYLLRSGNFLPNRAKHSYYFQTHMGNSREGEEEGKLGGGDGEGSGGGGLGEG